MRGTGVEERLEVGGLLCKLWVAWVWGWLNEWWGAGFWGRREELQEVPVVRELHLFQKYVLMTTVSGNAPGLETDLPGLLHLTDRTC